MHGQHQEPVADDVPERPRHDRLALADDVGLDPALLGTPVGTLDRLAQLRVRLGRALALTPRLLLAEHPNALVDAVQVGAAAEGLARAVSGRGVSMLVVTGDVSARARGEIGRLGWDVVRVKLLPEASLK